MMKHWSSDVVACSDETEISPAAAQKLQQHGIELRSEAVSSLVGAAGRLTRIKFVSGPDLEREGFFSRRVATRLRSFRTASAAGVMRRAGSSSTQ